VTEQLPPDWPSWRRSTDLDAYERRWELLAASGLDQHGEVAFVETFAPRSVLDAGCGTGRIARELARRGVAVVGVDNDPDLLDVARAKAPDLRWILADLAELTLPERFDVVLLAGNVVPYVPADRRADVVAACARHVAHAGVLVAGFALRPDWPDLAGYDGWCAAAGFGLAGRWATWDRAPYTGGDYAVSVHTPNASTA
jgi:SAM-dependent methyltransferase